LVLDYNHFMGPFDKGFNLYFFSVVFNISLFVILSFFVLPLISLSFDWQYLITHFEIFKLFIHSGRTIVLPISHSHVLWYPTPISRTRYIVFSYIHTFVPYQQTTIWTIPKIDSRHVFHTPSQSVLHGSKVIPHGYTCTRDGKVQILYLHLTLQMIIYSCPISYIKCR
jgi:hypothetical protein